MEGTGMSAHEYTIMLSDREVDSLAWLSDHGYWPLEAFDAMGLHESELEDETTDLGKQRAWAIPEHAAWSIPVMANEDPDAFLACCGSPLLEKLVELWGSIV